MRVSTPAGTSPNVLRAIAIAIGLGGIPHEPAHAQRSDPPSISCAQAEATIRAGNTSTAALPMWNALARCPSVLRSAGPDAIRNTRRISDLTTLMATVGTIAHSSEPELLPARIEVATDKAAAVNARSVAIWTLIKHGTGRQLGVDLKSMMTDGANCSYGYVVSARRAAHLNRPADQAKVRPVLESLSKDASEPATVRNAAACARHMIRELREK